MMEIRRQSHPDSSGRQKTVFLFKSPNGNEIDKFTEILEDSGLNCVTIPVLSFNFINQSVLKSHLAVIHLFSAIIFTSVRSVEAVGSVLKEMTDLQNISKIETFVVGSTTAEAARKLGFTPKGEKSGNAQELAEFILESVGSEEYKPMLYPCSNIHRDALKETLLNGGLEVTEVISYETGPNENLKVTTKNALEAQGLPDFAVFFSPSGFQYTIKVLDKGMLPIENIKIIALGPSTYKSICDQGYTPYAMTEKPNPKNLLEFLL